MMMPSRVFWKIKILLFSNGFLGFYKEVHNKMALRIQNPFVMFAMLDVSHKMFWTKMFDLLPNNVEDGVCGLDH